MRLVLQELLANLKLKSEAGDVKGSTFEIEQAPALEELDSGKAQKNTRQSEHQSSTDLVSDTKSNQNSDEDAVVVGPHDGLPPPQQKMNNNGSENTAEGLQDAQSRMKMPQTNPSEKRLAAKFREELNPRPDVDLPGSTQLDASQEGKDAKPIHLSGRNRQPRSAAFIQKQVDLLRQMTKDQQAQHDRKTAELKEIDARTKALNSKDSPTPRLPPSGPTPGPDATFMQEQRDLQRKMMEDQQELANLNQQTALLTAQIKANEARTMELIASMQTGIQEMNEILKKGNSIATSAL